MSTIRLAGIVKESYTDGVGIRYTVFVQGCSHKCKSCQNPETWDFQSGYDKNIDEIIADLLEDPLLDGVTLSGGDPMYQTEAVSNLIDAIRAKTNLNIWMFTGFLYEDCLVDPDKLNLLKKIDVLVDGPYIESKRSLELRFRGSSNQRVIDVQKSLQNNNVTILID